MRKIILTAVLSLGALAAVAATPSSAKAFWRMGMTMPAVNTTGVVYRPGFNPYYNSYYLNGYGYSNYYSNTYYKYTKTSSTYYTPWSYSTYVTPGSISKQWTGRGSVGWTYNPYFGLSYTITTPQITGFSNSYYYGYQPYVIPSQTYTVPAGYVIP